MQTTKCLKPSTSGRLQVSTPICAITLFGTGILFISGEMVFCSLPCLCHSSHFLTYSDTSAKMICQKNLSDTFWYVVSLPRCDAIAFALGFSHKPLWISSIIWRCSSFDFITNLLFLYISRPLAIEKFLQARRKFLFFPLSPFASSG